MEITEKLKESVAPILEQQEMIRKIVDTSSFPKFDISLPAIDGLKKLNNSNINKIIQENAPAMTSFVENGGAMKVLSEASAAFDSLQNNNLNHIFSAYKFESPAFKAIETWNSAITENFANSLNALISNPLMQEIQSINSNLGKWLQTIDFSPLTRILENVQNIGFSYDYDKVNETFLKAMFDARWFPYAGWIADFKIARSMLEILDTSRASKNRVKRIDKLIFSYYDKEEINNLKRGWRKKNLPSYMTRILVQSIQAYHRREYALTVSALSTLWEGIIQEKVNDTSFRISRKTRENLSKLIEENEFDKIFSSFCDEFIFYNCTKPEDVKPDVPGRHGIAHCWYDTYPNRKMALNAILFTDFLLELKPLEKVEEETNGQTEDAHAE